MSSESNTPNTPEQVESLVEGLPSQSTTRRLGEALAWEMRRKIEGGTTPEPEPPPEATFRGMCGTVCLYFGTTPPAGWLLCNGQSVLPDTHPELFAALGKRAAVPDLTDRFLASAPSAQDMHSAVSPSLPKVPAHEHETDSLAHSHSHRNRLFSAYAWGGRYGTYTGQGGNVGGVPGQHQGSRSAQQPADRGGTRNYTMATLNDGHTHEVSSTSPEVTQYLPPYVRAVYIICADASVTEIPVGGIVLYPDPDPWPGWVLCDGSTVDAATYPELAALLPSGTLPQLDEFVLGTNDEAKVGERGGEAGLRMSNMASHTHTLTNDADPHTHTTPGPYMNARPESSLVFYPPYTSGDERGSLSFNTSTYKYDWNTTPPGTFTYRAEEAALVAAHGHEVTSVGSSTPSTWVPGFVTMSYLMRAE